MKIQDVMIHLLLKQPFYGYIAASLTPAESSAVKTVKVQASPNLKLLYNRAWFEALPLEKAIGALMHEMLHIILLHSFRKGNRDHNLWAVACDMAVNEHISKELLWEDAVTVEKIAGALKHKLLLQKSAEYYYEIISAGDEGAISFKENDDELKVFLNTGAELTAGKTMEGDSSELNLSSAKSALSEIVQQAQYEGDIPSSICSHISELYKQGEVAWRNVLKRFLSGKGRTRVQKSYRKVSKRFEDLPGNIRTVGVDALVAIDESSSITDRQIEAFYSEMLAIKKVTGASVSVVQYDTECTKPVPLDRYVRSRSRVRNGGTDFRPVFRLADELRIPLLIIFTDGEGTIPDELNAGQKVIWLLTKEGKNPSGFGYCINISI